MGKAGRFQEHRQLWKEAFDDTEKYMEYFFFAKAPGSQILEDREDGQLCSMAFFTEYDAVLCGQKCRLPYITGVATGEKYRHEGRMSRILSEGMEWWRRRECPLVFLSPADTAIYEPLGFVPVYHRETTILEGTAKQSLKIMRWNELSTAQKKKTSEFAEKWISFLKNELHLLHHVAYYEEVHRELQALDGSLLIFIQEDEIVGVANWIYEAMENEVTELICIPHKAKRVAESLLAWIPGDTVKIDDSAFLGELHEEGILREKQKKPYIMCRSLCNRDLTYLRCYINDIT